MPTYEYVCSSCGHEWEAEQRITADALKTCPKCSNETAKRQVSGGSFILKGGGWYADLYSSAKPAAAKTDSGSTSGSGTGASKSTAPAKTDSSSSSSGSGGSSGSGSGSSGSGSSGGSSGSSGSGSGGSTPSST